MTTPEFDPYADESFDEYRDRRLLIRETELRRLLINAGLRAADEIRHYAKAYYVNVDEAIRQHAIHLIERHVQQRPQSVYTEPERADDQLQAALDKAEREFPGFTARLLRELARDCIDVGGTGPLVALARLVPFDDDATGGDGLYEWNPTEAQLVALVTGEYERESDEAAAAAERRMEGD